jgi:hypothetical protein
MSSFLPSPEQIAWKPTDKQSEFLSAPEDEVLYGGAAGGGKSDALVIDALGLQQAAIEWGGYRAILFRRTFPELRELIDRTRAIYPIAAPGATFSESNREWTFPSGAKIEFGYLESEADRFRYQGRQFQYLGWDEMTQWATDTGYKYLLSRLRTVNPAIKCYVRATCNPGGIGHEWVKEYWGIDDAGSPSRIEREVEGVRIARRFIPARLADNPHLATSGYRERLLTLSLSEQKALLYGRWDVVDVTGAILADEMTAAMAEGRITRIPIERGIPVDTYWDLGGDGTVIWFKQTVGFEKRFIDHYKEHIKDPAHYAQVLQSKGYLYGTHYMPHDAGASTLGSAGKTLKELFEEAGLRNVEIVKRATSKQVPIALLKRAFGKYWFDAERCGAGLKALRNWRYRWIEQDKVFSREPLHDWASHDADSLMAEAQAEDQGLGQAKDWGGSLHYNNAGRI